MFKVLFYTDPHYTGKAPASRIDGGDYLSNLFKKTREVFDIARLHNVDLIINGGDFFDSSEISDAIATQVGQLYMEAPVDVYVVPGNHDVKGNNYQTIRQTKLGLLSGFNIVKILDEYNPLILEKNNKTLMITANQSDVGIDDNEDAYISPNKTTDFLMHVVHAMLLRHKPQFGSYMPLNKIIDNTAADVTASGHYHLGFETLIYKSPLSGQKKIFANPGALARKSALLEEISRPIKVDIFSFNCETMDVSIEEIELKTALSGEEVLDRTKLESKKDYEEKVLNFKASLSTKSFAVKVDPIDLIDSMKKETSLSKEVIEEATARLLAAKEKIQKGENLND